MTMTILFFDHKEGTFDTDTYNPHEVKFHGNNCKELMSQYRAFSDNHNIVKYTLPRIIDVSDD